MLNYIVVKTLEKNVNRRIVNSKQALSKGIIKRKSIS